MVVRLLLDHFRRHVERSALEGSQHFCLIAHAASEPEIAQFYNTIAGHENVLGFHISMSDAIGVYVMQGSDQLLRYLAYFYFFQRLVVLDDIEELALSQFCDQDELCVGFEGVEEENDVLVLEFFEYLNFVAHHFDVLLLLALLLDRFDGHELACELASRLVDLAIGALSYQ